MGIAARGLATAESLAVYYRVATRFVESLQDYRDSLEDDMEEGRCFCSRLNNIEYNKALACEYI